MLGRSTSPKSRSICRRTAVSVDDFVALQEVGKVLHPVLARGQIIGGVAQGIGFALYEKVVWQNGRMQNGQMTNYIMPTSADLPPIRVFFEEMGNVHGAYGAKGIGELPMDGPAPAIVNAIVDALGVPFDSIPLLPEDIFQSGRGSRRNAARLAGSSMSDFAGQVRAFRSRSTANRKRSAPIPWNDCWTFCATSSD